MNGYLRVHRKQCGSLHCIKHDLCKHAVHNTCGAMEKFSTDSDVLVLSKSQECEHGMSQNVSQ